MRKSWGSRLAASLADRVELNLTELEALLQPDQAIALALFDYCFNRGLSEEERSAVSDSFAPFVLQGGIHAKTIHGRTNHRCPAGDQSGWCANPGSLPQTQLQRILECLAYVSG
jgi:hypothetical protein